MKRVVDCVAMETSLVLSRAPSGIASAHGVVWVVQTVRRWGGGGVALELVSVLFEYQCHLKNSFASSAIYSSVKGISYCFSGMEINLRKNHLNFV